MFRSVVFESSFNGAAGARRLYAASRYRHAAWFALVVLLTTCGLAAQMTEDIRKLAGVARVFRDLSSAGSADPEAGRLFDFELVVAAITGLPAVGGHSMQEYRDALAGRLRVAIPLSPGWTERDDTAYRLHGLGYSAKEIADVLSGRITRSALDNAQKMLMLGGRQEQVSDFLDREYARLAAARERTARQRERLARRAPAAGSPASFDAILVRLAATYGVDPVLVRAVVACESGWDPGAVSRVGAVGLMQIMPGTARDLGVDPRDPIQNLDGGIRYLASLLRAFGNIEHALVAYNAGPGFASRFAGGRAALYGETRAFVQAVVERMAREQDRP